MKKMFLFLAILFTSASVSFAGGPMTAQEVPSAQTQEKPKMVTAAYAYDDYAKVTKHFTIGAGIGGNPMIGYVDKDGFGYAKDEYGFTWCLGFGYTWFSGQPTEKQLTAALEAISSKYGARIDEKKLPSMVREETGIKTLQYVELGTALLVLPINAEMGTMWILSDNVRTRLGFGLPTLISFGINLDF